MSRLWNWLDQLGPKSAEVLETCMDLLARGVIAPAGGAPA